MSAVADIARHADGIEKSRVESWRLRAEDRTENTHISHVAS